MLYLIATPIGNLSDITFRAISTMQECDYLLCEDTRRSRILLNHYKIEKPLKSYHQFNEAKRTGEILEDLKNGKKIGLLSDAGSPCIADPGYRLVVACRSEELDVIPIPGPCAIIAAITASGLDTERFQFIGFLPKKSGQLTRILTEALSYPGTTVCYESPFRTKKSLAILEKLDPTRKIVIARELTKKFEEIVQGTPTTLKERTFKGEIVLLISGIEN